MATAYICPMCVFNCDNLPDLEQHLEGEQSNFNLGNVRMRNLFLAHENNSIQSPVKRQPPNKSVRSSPLYAKSQVVLNLVRFPRLFTSSLEFFNSPSTNSKIFRLPIARLRR